MTILDSPPAATNVPVTVVHAFVMTIPAGCCTCGVALMVDPGEELVTTIHGLNIDSPRISEMRPDTVGVEQHVSGCSVARTHVHGKAIGSSRHKVRSKLCLNILPATGRCVYKKSEFFGAGKTGVIGRIDNGTAYSCVVTGNVGRASAA